MKDNLLQELQLFSAQQITAESKSTEFLILHQLFEEYTKASNSTNIYDAQSAIITDVVGDLESNIDKIDNNNIFKNSKSNNIGC